MKKLTVLAIVALFVTGSAFAGLTKEANATFTPGTLTSGGILAGLGPSTTNNDDSCDIGTAPAATLLLPYFQVDLGTAGTGRTTIFSITNVSPYAQIAHVVLYTDWSFPVLDFNIFLTGYDVQPINLYDIIARGLIGSTTGTSTSSPDAHNNTTGATSNYMDALGGPNGTNPNIGSQPFRTSGGDLFGNPNFLGSVAANCGPGRLPGQLPAALATDVRALLSTGRSTGAGISCPTVGGEAQVGGNHGGNVAIGYATIDVAATCSVALPIDPGYFTGEILFDNVLIGDYQDINQSTSAGNYAGGNPLVHIRAIPEGGPAGSAIATNLPFTFYDRYQGGALTPTLRTVDRRQPLPSSFAARWISGSTAAFDTAYKIWREGFTANTGGPHFLVNPCDEYIANSVIPLVEIVRFDENENAGVRGLGIIVSPPTTASPTTPEASLNAVSTSLFPTVPGSTDVGGWTYFNLSNGGDFTANALYGPGFFPYNATRPGFGTSFVGAAGFFPRDVSQNWVILQMFAEGRYGVDQDANWLGNGCSPASPSTSTGPIGLATNVPYVSSRIAPAGGVLVCPTGVTTTNTATANAQCTGTNVTP